MPKVLGSNGKWVALLGLAAVALFAGGAGLGFAVGDSGDKVALQQPAGIIQPPNPFAGFAGRDGAETNLAAETDAADDVGGGGVAADYSYPRYALCSAPIDVAASGSVIDLTNSGFVMNLLGDGYTLKGLSVRSEGECDENGQATSGFLTLDSSWTHVASGYEVWVAQRVSPDAQPNVRYDSSLNFWENGYYYTVYVNSYIYYPVDDAARTEPLNPADDPQVQAVLDDVIATLAPGIGAQCFYTQAQGTWDDLAALGIGDPRGAIPAGFVESYLNVTTFTPPADGCPVAGDPPIAPGFNAGFTRDDGTSGWLDISAWAIGGGDVMPYGYLDSYSVSWSNGTWAFNVYGHDGTEAGLGTETLQAIARAMDPAFSPQCFVQERQLDPSELAGLGFGQPAIPDGYSLESSSLRIQELPAGCSNEDYNGPTVNLYWNITNGDNTYSVEASRYPLAEGEDRPEEGWISDYGMNWSKPDGTYYAIWASSSGVTGIPDRDTMVAIATSLDPTLDPSTLTEGDGPKPLPMPARDATGGSNGSAGGGAAEAAPATAVAD